MYRFLGVRRVLRTAAFSAAVALACGMLSAPPAAADDGGSVGSTAVASPGRLNTVVVSALDGRLSYQVRHRGRTLVKPSSLGLELYRGGTLGGDVEIVGTRVREKNSAWRPVWGADAKVRNHYRELVVRTRGRSAPHHLLDVVVRAYDDGVAVRYRVPRQRGLDRLRVVGEVTGLRLAGDPTTWWHPRNDESDEDLYRQTPYTKTGAANLPVTFRYPDGVHVSAHEADLVDYPAAVVEPSGAPDGLRYSLVPTPDRPYAVDTTAGRSTPWRSLTIGDRAGDLMESHLLENLNPPCAICDEGTSWIKPTKYVGIWWDLHHGRYTWQEGPDHGATTERAKEYIDFAADHGIGGLLAEGWNKGWDGSWADQDFTRAADGFDLEEVVRYGHSKGVEFIAHNETGAGVENYEKQIDEAFALYERLGIHYLKTGYVGAIPGHRHYDQRMVNHFRTVLRKAAEHHIMLDCHECIHATGEVRTYPNALSREAMRGQEYDAFSEGNPPGHTLTLPFTRGLAGPMDYTPGIVDITYDPQRAGHRVHTTIAKQLAYYVQFLSGVQMAADTPDNYRHHPDALAFIEKVPATWDRTKVISGEIGDRLTVARRRGRTWYLGSSTDERGRNLAIPLSFLPRGRYVAETWTDDASADYDTRPGQVERRRFLVDRSDVLRSAVEAGGGQAVRLTPATRHQQAALPEYTEPRFAYPGTDAPRTAVAGDLVTVGSRVRNTGSLVGRDRVVVTVDGKRTDARQVRINGESSAAVTFDVRLPETGRHSVAVGDAPARWITVEPASAAPAAPTGLAVTDASAYRVELRWKAPSPSYSVSEYRVYRRAEDGSLGSDPLATVPGGSTAFVDRKVTTRASYGYAVRAVDRQGRLSPASNLVTARTEPKSVQVTFRVKVPSSTPAGDRVYLVGTLDALGPWDPGKHPMTDRGNGVWETTLPVLEGSGVQYKYTRGAWEYVEWWDPIVGPANRSVQVSYGEDGTQLVDDTSAEASTPWQHRAPQKWRDPLVVGHTAESGKVSVRFERAVRPLDGGDLKGSVRVTRDGTPVSGAVTQGPEDTLVWSPAAPLAAGTYGLEVRDVSSALGSDSVPMRTPHRTTFTIG